MLLQSSLQKIHSLATKYLKKWLCLPRNATLYHPSGLNCPNIPAIKMQAKISYTNLTSTCIFTYPDHLLHELKFQTDNHARGLGFLMNHSTFLQAARRHIQCLPTAKKLARIGKCLAISEEGAYSNPFTSSQNCKPH